MTEQALLILASLAGGELHGYGIAREAEALSGGRTRLTAGTLYGALGRLEEEGLVEQTREEVVDGRRRRYYRLSGPGRSRLSQEADHMSEVAAAIRSSAGKARRGVARPA